MRLLICRLADCFRRFVAMIPLRVVLTSWRIPVYGDSGRPLPGVVAGSAAGDTIVVKGLRSSPLSATLRGSGRSFTEDGDNGFLKTSAPTTVLDPSDSSDVRNRGSQMVLFAGDGDDTIHFAGPGDDSADGGSGTSFRRGSEADAFGVYGGAGRDTILLDSARVRIGVGPFAGQGRVSGGDGDDVISLYQGHRRIYDPSNRTVDSFLGETLPYRTLSDVRAGETLSVDRVTGDGGDDSIEVSYVPRAASVEAVSGGTVSQISGGGGDDSIRVTVHSALDSAARYSGTTTALIGPTISEIAGDDG